MKPIIGLLGSVLFASVLFGQAAQDMHSPQSFMPALEGWKVVKVSPLAHEKRRFRKDKLMKGGETRDLKGPNGLKGELIIVKGVIVLKAAEISKDHLHVALLTEDGKWIFGEGSTLTLPSPDQGIQFCLEDYFTKKPTCGAEITFTTTWTWGGR